VTPMNCVATIVAGDIMCSCFSDAESSALQRPVRDLHAEAECPKGPT
jgi:hypothetical protein